MIWPKTHNKLRFRTKSLGVDLPWADHQVQDLHTGVRLGLVSELGMNESRFSTKSFGVDLYLVHNQFTWGRLSEGSEL